MHFALCNNFRPYNHISIGWWPSITDIGPLSCQPTTHKVSSFIISENKQQWRKQTATITVFEGFRYPRGKEKGIVPIFYCFFTRVYLCSKVFEVLWFIFQKFYLSMLSNVGINFRIGHKTHHYYLPKRCNHCNIYCTDWLRFAHTISSCFKNNNNEHWTALAKPKSRRENRRRRRKKIAHNISMKDDKRLFLPSFWVLSASKLQTLETKTIAFIVCAIYAMCFVLICVMCYRNHIV